MRWRGSFLLLLVEHEAVSADQGFAFCGAAVLPIVLPWLVASWAAMYMAHFDELLRFDLEALAAALEQHTVSLYICHRRRDLGRVRCSRSCHGLAVGSMAG